MTIIIKNENHENRANETFFTYVIVSIQACLAGDNENWLLLSTFHEKDSVPHIVSLFFFIFFYEIIWSYLLFHSLSTPLKFVPLAMLGRCTLGCQRLIYIVSSVKNVFWSLSTAGQWQWHWHRRCGQWRGQYQDKANHWHFAGKNTENKRSHQEGAKH